MGQSGPFLRCGRGSTQERWRITVPHAVVVINPKAGGGSAASVGEVVRHRLSEAGWEYQIQATGDVEHLRRAVRSALDKGVDACVAVGGDGTVSAVAGALVHSGVPLAIVPSGTGNVLARELGIPSDAEGAMSLLLGPHTTRRIDALRVGDRHFFLAIGVGLSAVMMRDTSTQDKGHYGRLAYIWAGLKALVGLQPQAFSIIVDGLARRVRASEVMIANLAAVGDPAIRWGSHVRPDDGVMDVCIIRARSLWDWARMAWSVLTRQPRIDSHLSFLSGEKSAQLEAQRPLPVQGDGDLVGHTPIEVQLVREAVALIVPRTA